MNDDVKRSVRLIEEAIKNLQAYTFLRQASFQGESPETQAIHLLIDSTMNP